MYINLTVCTCDDVVANYCQHHATCRVHKTVEVAQEEKELNRYENLCASRVQDGVYVEECDYGEFKVKRGQEDRREGITHQLHCSTTNEYTESTQVTQMNKEPSYRNIVHSCPGPPDQTQASSNQQSVLPKTEIADDEHNGSKSCKLARATKHQIPKEGTEDVDEEVYDDIQPAHHTQKGGRPGRHDPHHPEKKAAADSTPEKFDDQNDYGYTTTPSQSSAAVRTTRYQPLLSREIDYENNLGDYNSINASQRNDERGSDEEYQYVTTKPRYTYRPSVK